MEAGVHCMGNGRLAVYARGPELLQVFGPPYSGSSAIGMAPAAPPALEARSEREPGTAAWTHELRLAGASIGRIVDFVDAELPVLVRALDLLRPLELDLRVGEGAEVLENGRRFAARGAGAALLVTQPRGTPVFMRYPSPVPFFHQVVVSGRATLRRAGDGWRIACEPGASQVVVAGGAGLPACLEAAEAALATPAADLLARTRAWWRAFTARRAGASDLVPAGAPRRADLLAAVDDVAVLIKAQQGAEGGILAGPSYHWAAFRDQHGAARALLALGHHGEARAVLAYYADLFARRGALHNGQDVGLDGFSHVHENDEVEITGYLLLQAFEYLDASGDEEFVRGLFPMLALAFDAQRRNLVRHMLPFNGDETYIAGGMLPRAAINDGSAESTMLFAEGGRRFLAWTARHRLWPADRLDGARAALAGVRARFRENFLGDGRLAANNPGRVAIDAMPRFRHGVCESGAYLPECAGLACQGGTIGWVERSAGGHYLCPACIARGVEFPPDRRVHHLASVSLVPSWIGSDLLSPSDIAAAAGPIIDRFARTGMLTTTDDAAGTVGYDWGLFLATLDALGHPLAARAYDRLLDARDAAGAWVEYYRDGLPTGCPCRPYESGINLAAALAHARRHG